MEYFFTAFFCLIIGAGAMYLFIRNKTSTNPNSYHDELEALRTKYEELRRKYTENE